MTETETKEKVVGDITNYVEGKRDTAGKPFTKALAKMDIRHLKRIRFAFQQMERVIDEYQDYRELMDELTAPVSEDSDDG